MYRKKFITLMMLGASMPGLAVTALTTSVKSAKAASGTATKIANMPVFAQQHYLSCEYAASRAAAAVSGVDLSEWDFIRSIATNENPHLGFRGNIDNDWGGIQDYGIYPEPIARFLTTRGLKTKLLWDGIESVKEELLNGRPVVVWVIGSMEISYPVSVTSAGETSFTLAPSEHVMTLYGFDEAGVLAANPGFGTYEYYSWDSFVRSWSVLGQMALSVWPSSQPLIKDERPGIDPAFYAFWLNHSGLEIIGQPLGAAFMSNGKLVQYFERARLEWEVNQPPVDQYISRGLLGWEFVAQRRSEEPFIPLSASEIAGLSTENRANYFSATNFYLDSDFTAFWQNKGGLAAFGYPISRPFIEDGLKVQYFERAELQLYPGKHGQKSNILVGLLGSRRWSQI